MQVLNLLVWWFCPDFLTRFTTVIGQTIYLPSRAYVQQHEASAMRTLAHEMVHMLDQERFTKPVFMLGYLFPQILAVGVFSFPWLGLWSLGFLLFLLPWPAPFRAHVEIRAYALDILTSSPGQQAQVLAWASHQFSSWSYYKMYPFTSEVEHALQRQVRRVEKGEDAHLLKVLLVYELIANP